MEGQDGIGKLDFIHIYYGDGKGKTTSALGSALRACGHGFNVHLVQFMKNDSQALESGEIKALLALPTFSFKRFGSPGWVTKENISRHKSNAILGLNYLKSCYSKGYDLIIADEILYALELNLLEGSEVISLLDSKPTGVGLILTGSHTPYPEIFSKADLVSEIKKIKHHFDKGITSKKGVEF